MDETEIYTLGNWKGFVQYNCNFCPFDSLDKSEILAHYQARHAPPPPPPPSSGLIFVADKNGNPVQTENQGLFELTEDDIQALEQPKRRKRGG